MIVRPEGAVVKPVVAMVGGRPQEEGVPAQTSITTSKATPDFGSLAREIKEAEHGLGIFFQCIIHTGTKISIWAALND